MTPKRIEEVKEAFDSHEPHTATPGKMLQEELDWQDITVVDAAYRIDVTVDTLAKVLDGRRPIDEWFSRRIARTLGGDYSPDHWLDIQRMCDAGRKANAE